MTRTIENKFITREELDELSEQGHEVKLINYSGSLHLIKIDVERYNAKKCTGKRERYKIIKYLGEKNEEKSFNRI